MRQTGFFVTKVVRKDSLTYQGETLLTYRIEYPEIRAYPYQLCLLRINQFYRSKAAEFQRYCETKLFPMAIAQYREGLEQGYPIRVFDAVQSYEITYLNSCIISLYFDRYEYTGGAHGNTIRQSQTWDLKRCTALTLNGLVIYPQEKKAYILNAVSSQIKKEPELYFENYAELIAETFQETSFYCTPDGLIIYYQQYDIAPYSSGIREFLLPYGDCVLDPVRLCTKR